MDRRYRNTFVVLDLVRRFNLACILLVIAVLPSISRASTGYQSYASCSAAFDNFANLPAKSCETIDQDLVSGLQADKTLTTIIQSSPLTNQYHTEATVRSGAGSLGVATLTTLKGVTPPGYSFSRVTAFSSASFFDTIVVSSSTLPRGTITDINLNQILSFSLYSSGMAGGNPDASGYSWIQLQFTASSSYDLFHIDTCLGFSFPSNVGCAAAPTNGSEQNLQYGGVISTYIGDTINLSATLSSHSDAYLYSAASDLGFSLAASSMVSSLHSAHTFLTVSDSSIHLLSESGHDYSISPVPEPSTYYLYLLGLAILFFRRLKMASFVSAA